MLSLRDGDSAPTAAERGEEPASPQASAPVGRDGAAGESGSSDPFPAGGWPDDVKDLLLHASEEAVALRAERQSLVARVGQLESMLEASESKRARMVARVREIQARPPQPPAPAPQPSPRAGAARKHRPEEQWLAGVVERTAHTLRSGQKAAQQIVDRARVQAAEIEQAALHQAAEIRKRADAEAEKILSVAQYDAEGLLEGAQASGRELIAEIQQLRQRAIVEFRKQRAALQAEIDDLEARRVTLLQTYAAMKRPVEDAMRVLESGPPSSGNAARPRGRAVLQWLMNVDPPHEAEAGEDDRR